MHSTSVNQPADSDPLAPLLEILAETPLIVEVEFGAGDPHPERYVFHQPARLEHFVRMMARPGDVVRAWRWDQACPAERAIAVVLPGNPDA